MKKNTLTMHLLEEPTNFLNKMIVKHIKRIQFSIDLLEKRTNFLKTLVKYMKKNTKKLKYFITSHVKPKIQSKYYKYSYLYMKKHDSLKVLSKNINVTHKF